MLQREGAIMHLWGVIIFYLLSEVEEILHKPPDTVDAKKSEIYKKNQIFVTAQVIDFLLTIEKNL
jgi:hypothetical protein